MKQTTPLAVVGVCLAAWAALAFSAERDAGRGDEVKNVEVMDPSTRLAEARIYMLQFNEALGVECKDCHVVRDFASDDVPLKHAARDMMRMQAELNAKFFPGQGERITCWTCHRGSRIPPQESLGDATDTAGKAANAGKG